MGIHTRGMPISDEFDMEWVLENSYGFVGADISALVREGAMKALRRYLPEIDLEAEEVSPEVLEKMEVTMDDFKLAMREIEPSALREIYIEVPEKGWEDVGGLEVPVEDRHGRRRVQRLHAVRDAAQQLQQKRFHARVEAPLPASWWYGHRAAG